MTCGEAPAPPREPPDPDQEPLEFPESRKLDVVPEEPEEAPPPTRPPEEEPLTVP
jgi:hypothetical protein